MKIHNDVIRTSYLFFQANNGWYIGIYVYGQIPYNLREDVEKFFDRAPPDPTILCPDKEMFFISRVGYAVI